MRLGLVLLGIVDRRCMTSSICWLTVLPTVCLLLLLGVWFASFVSFRFIGGSAVLLVLAPSEIVWSGWELSQLPRL